MTSRPAATEIENAGFIQLPDPPIPEDMNNFKHLHAPGNTHFLVEHLGNPDTTIVTGRSLHQPGNQPANPWVCWRRTCSSPSTSTPMPAATVTATSSRSRGSRRTSYWKSARPAPGGRDATVKRDGYAALGILEYWRFDPSGGRYHGAAIAGVRLVGGVYQPIPIETFDEGTYQGHSEVLNLDLRWEQGQLGWYDSATGPAHHPF